MTDKTCCRCDTTKPIGQFYRSSKTEDGRHRHCMECHKAGDKRAAEKRKLRAKGILPPKPEYTPEEYREKRKADKRRYYAADPEKHRAKAVENRKKFEGYYAAYFKEHRAKKAPEIKAYLRQYHERTYEERKPIFAAQAMKRYSRKRHAFPAWADLDAIKVIYAQAADITKRSGIVHHVDHIVPIMGKTVCGLHVAHNLQILTEVENKAKGNRHWPDMP